MSGISTDRCPYSGEPFFGTTEADRCLRSQTNTDIKTPKNYLEKETKSPLQNHARDENFRGTTQVLFAYRIIVKRCLISQRTLIDVRNVHKTSTATERICSLLRLRCESQWLPVFKGTFSRWFPLSEKSITICGKLLCLHHLCLFNINFDSNTVFLKHQALLFVKVYNF